MQFIKNERWFSGKTIMTDCMGVQVAEEAKITAVLESEVKITAVLESEVLQMFIQVQVCVTCKRKRRPGVR